MKRKKREISFSLFCQRLYYQYIIFIKYVFFIMYFFIKNAETEQQKLSYKTSTKLNLVKLPRVKELC